MHFPPLHQPHFPSLTSAFPSFSMHTPLHIPDIFHIIFPTLNHHFPPLLLRHTFPSAMNHTTFLPPCTLSLPSPSHLFLSPRPPHRPLLLCLRQDPPAAVSRKRDKIAGNSLRVTVNREALASTFSAAHIRFSESALSAELIAVIRSPPYFFSTLFPQKECFK